MIGKLSLGPLKKPGQIIAAALDPIGYLAQGSKAGQTFSKITRPHHYFLFKKTGLTYDQQVAAVQEEAHQRLRARRDSPLPPPPEPITVAPDTRAGSMLVFALTLAGVILLGATFWSIRR